MHKLLCMIRNIFGVQWVMSGMIKELYYEGNLKEKTEGENSDNMKGKEL